MQNLARPGNRSSVNAKMIRGEKDMGEFKVPPNMRQESFRKPGSLLMLLGEGSCRRILVCMRVGKLPGERPGDSPLPLVPVWRRSSAE